MGWEKIKKGKNIFVVVVAIVKFQFARLDLIHFSVVVMMFFFGWGEKGGKISLPVPVVGRNGH